ncbi:MAG: PHP domain-containing protein [Candidatus Abyssobacteria bacterium SURF_17]|uniref:PHP domain-containing protein n=1 Tax=Candidatus Abyssobacteria bacterium SURF_17 TaxID=2093361 RepID=A0A419EVP4_9BACT|nr:MAG: PHP domain-containing protein [Candidatus Abyssubacteria bacterium SURF_17]
MDRYADLHVHTIYSDGSFTPEEVILRAKELGFAAIGIADHDEVSGITEAIWIGHSHGIEIVPAVEISSGFNGKEIHLLGYLIDHNHRHLRERLKEFRYERFKRTQRMVDRLRKLGIDISIETVRKIGGRGSLGRLHLARALFDRGCVRTVQEAFERYIGKDKPAYVEKPRIDIREAFELISAAGGISVLAHPKLVRIDGSIPELVESGLRGIEAYCPKHARDDTDRYLAIAAKYNLMVTGGSDCHGIIKDSALLGTVKLPYHYLAALRERANQTP